MQDDASTSLLPIVAKFRVGGDLISIEAAGSGHINETYVSRVRTDRGLVRFVHQKINRSVFRSPQRVMDNIERVLAHLRTKILARGGDPERRTLTLVPAIDGRCFHVSPEGDCWRTYRFVEDARSFDTAQGPDHARQVGRAFAEFQRMLADLPGPRLHETIPHFGDTRRRFDSFTEALEQDAHHRAAAAAAEIRFAQEREALAGPLVDLVRSGTVPERVIHYDTKINNVLIDDRTGEGLCVIDLDTVMPGTALYDFGDSVRLGAARSAEDETDLSAVGLDLDLFEALARGWLESHFLTEAELGHLALSSKLVTFVTGVRFLTDYLYGDVYFKTHREGHNLDRCRAQFAMVREMEAKAEQMEAIVERSRP